MDGISQIIRELILLLLLASLLELLLPRGRTAGFVRLVLGLCLLAVVLTPLVRLLAGEDPLAPLSPLEAVLVAPAGAATEYIEQGQELAAGLQQQAGEEYLAQLGRQLSALAVLAPGVEAATATPRLDSQGGLLGATLYLQARPEAADAAAAAARQLVCGFYLLDEAQVECVVDTETDG